MIIRKDEGELSASWAVARGPVLRRALGLVQCSDIAILKFLTILFFTSSVLLETLRRWCRTCLGTAPSDR